MRTWLARRLVNIARILSNAGTGGDYYAEWPPSTKNNGTKIYPTYGPEGYDVLPRLEIVDKSGTLNICGLWYDGRSYTLGIEITSSHDDRGREKFQARMARYDKEADNNSTRQGRGTSGLSSS